MPRPTAAQHWFEWHAFTAPGGQPTLLMLTTPGLRVYAQLWDLRSGAVVCTLEHGVGSWQVHVDLGVFAYISSYVSSQLPLFSAASVYVSVCGIAPIIRSSIGCGSGVSARVEFV